MTCLRGKRDSNSCPTHLTDDTFTDYYKTEVHRQDCLIKHIQLIRCELSGEPFATFTVLRHE